MFQQGVLPVQDKVRFSEIKLSLDQTFAPANVGRFLRRLNNSKLRADFEGVLASGLLGADAIERYEQLPVSDRAQIRELYLSLVERVAPELRAKFYKVYAYY